MSRRWRHTLTSVLHARYCLGTAFFRVNRSALDNADQRMTHDAAALCETLGEAGQMKYMYHLHMKYNYKWQMEFNYNWQVKACDTLVG